jgi:uncharacterized protein involved in exopolysaccharide biosynthesis
MAARSERTLRELVRIIAGRFLGMIAVFILVVAAAGVATWHVPKWYESEVEMLAKPSQIANQNPGIMRDRVMLYISTLRAMISSDNVLGSALLRLEDGITPPELPSGGLSSGSEALAKWTKDLEQWDLKVREFVAKNTDTIDDLRERLSVVTPGGPDATFTQILKVQVIWPEERELASELGQDSRELAAQRAQELAKNVVDAYKLRYAELEWKSATDATKFLSNKSLVAAKLALTKAEDAYTAFIRDKAGADLMDIQTMAGHSVGVSGKASLATTYAEKMTDIEELSAGLESIKEALQQQLKKDDDSIAVPDAIMTANASIKDVERKILSLKLHINALTPRYTEDYKELKTARSELASAYKELRNELKRQLTRTQQELDAQSAMRETVSTSYKAGSDRLRTLAISMAEWERLQAAQGAAQRRYDSETERVANATTAEELSSASITLTVLGDPSQPDPEEPSKPVLLINLIVAVIGGFILSLIYAFSADHFDHSLKGIDEAERYLGVPVLTSVPKLGRRIIRAKGGV